MNESPSISCPKCGSHDLYVGKKGFSGKKAVGGALLNGGIGLLAGTLGSNKIKITCLNCGHVFKPGDSAKTYVPTFRETLQANQRQIELKRELKRQSGPNSSDNSSAKTWRAVGLIGSLLFGFITLIASLVSVASLSDVSL
jgi:hypothetical protein